MINIIIIIIICTVVIQPADGQWLFRCFSSILLLSSVYIVSFSFSTGEVISSSINSVAQLEVTSQYSLSRARVNKTEYV